MKRKGTRKNLLDPVSTITMTMTTIATVAAKAKAKVRAATATIMMNLVRLENCLFLSGMQSQSDALGLLRWPSHGSRAGNCENYERQEKQNNCPGGKGKVTTLNSITTPGSEEMLNLTLQRSEVRLCLLLFDEVKDSFEVVWNCF